MPRAKPGAPPEVAPTKIKPVRELEMPGWENVIHLRPDWMLEPAELRAVKRDRAIRIATAPQAQFSRSATWLMTQIDNLQDALVTASVGLRTIALAVPRLKPLALLIGKAADTTNLATIAKGIGGAGSKGKRALEARFTQAPGYYQGRVRNVTNLRSALPNVAEALQILQTSDQLTGIGISLGALVSAPAQIIATAAQDLERTRPLPQRAPLSPKEADDLEAEWARNWKSFRPSVSTLGTGALATAVGVAMPSAVVIPLATELVSRIPAGPKQTSAELLAELARMFESTSWMGIMPHLFRPEDHLLAAVGYHAALVQLQFLGSSLSFARLAEPLLDVLVTPGTPTDPVTRWALREAGLDPNDPGVLPLEGSPRRASIRDIQAELQETVPKALPLWREDLATDDEEDVAGALCTYAAQAPWRILEGEDPLWKTSYTGPARALITLCDYGLAIPQDFPDDLVHQLLSDLSSVWYKSSPWQPTPDQAAKDFQDALKLLTP